MDPIESVIGPSGGRPRSAWSSVSFGPGYPPPPGGYGPPPGYGGPPPGGGGYGAPPGGGGGYGGPPGGFGGPPGYPGGGGFGGPPMGPMGGMPPSSGLAIAALVCGILAIPGACCCYSGIPLGIAAGIMGGIAMSKAKAMPEQYGGRGMAMAGLITGIVGVVTTLLLFAFGMSMQLVNALQNQ